MQTVMDTVKQTMVNALTEQNKIKEEYSKEIAELRQKVVAAGGSLT